MDSTNDFYSTSSYFKLNKEITKFDVNNNYIAVGIESNVIDIYSVSTFKKLFSCNVYLDILHIKFHPKYSNVFSVTLQNSTVNIYYINSKENKIKNKCEHFFSKNNLLKTIFSSYDDGKTLATICDYDIKIWRIDNYDYISNIKINLDMEKLNNFKWSESGEYLIFPKNEFNIGVYCLKTKSIEHLINIVVKDIFFLEQTKQMILVKKKKIIILDLKSNKEIFNLKFDSIINTNYDYFNSFLYLLNKKKILIYDFEKKKIIYEKIVNRCKNLFLLKNTDSNNPSIFSKIILYNSQKYEFEILIIFKKNNNNQKNSISIEEASEDYWENSINKIYNNYEHLSYIFNQKENNEIFKKKYISIEAIEEELNYLLKNYTLKEKRKIVADEIDYFNENENIENVYLNYIKYIIKDNTNKTLLIKYLKFLKNNNNKLFEQFKTKFENFDDEINQYQGCLSQTILKNELKYFKKESEQEKLLKFLKEFSLLDLDNMDVKEINDFINIKKSEIENFRFNQPISFENEDLYFYRNRIILIYNIKKIIEKNNNNTLKILKYYVQQVLNRNLFTNKEIIKNKIYLTFIIILIVIPQRMELTDYNLNLIDNDNNINVDENQLLKLGFKYNTNNDTYEYEKIFIKNDKNIMKLYNLKNLSLCINSHNEVFEEHELYKYDELMKYYYSKFDKEKVKEFISKILISNVFKEAFVFFLWRRYKISFY